MEISKVIILAAILFCVCATVTSAAGAGNSFVIKNADNGKEISVPMGGILDLQLQQAGATGYSWEIVSLDKSHLEVISSSTEAAKVEKPQIRVGGPVVMKWSIRAVAKGHTELKAALYRPWEGVDKAAEKFTVRINIE